MKNADISKDYTQIFAKPTDKFVRVCVGDLIGYESEFYRVYLIAEPEPQNPLRRGYNQAVGKGECLDLDDFYKRVEIRTTNIDNIKILKQFRGVAMLNSMKKNEVQLFHYTPSVSQPFVSAGDTFEVVGYNDRIFTVKSVDLAASTAVFELSSFTDNKAWLHTRTFADVKKSLEIDSWRRGLTCAERLEKELAKLKLENQ